MMAEQDPDRVTRLWAEHGFALSARVVVGLVVFVVLIGQLTARVLVAAQP